MLAERWRNFIAIGNDGNDLAFPGFDLLHIAHDFFVIGVFRSNEYHGKRFVDQGSEPGKFYDGVSSGPIAPQSIGYKANLGAMLWF